MRKTRLPIECNPARLNAIGRSILDHANRLRGYILSSEPGPGYSAYTVATLYRDPAAAMASFKPSAISPRGIRVGLSFMRS